MALIPGVKLSECIEFIDAFCVWHVQIQGILFDFYNNGIDISPPFGTVC